MQPSLLTSFRKTLKQLRELGAELTSVSLPTTAYALSTYYVISSAEASSNLARYDGIRYGQWPAFCLFPAFNLIRSAGARVPVEPRDDISRTSRTYAKSRTTGFGEEVQKRVLLGTYALTAE